MRRWLRGIPLLALLLCLQCLAGGQPVMLHYTTENGLATNNIYDIYRDRNGFMWLCTDKGVMRYNGIQFEPFTNYNNVADNEVFMMTEDQYGRLWLQTYSGRLGYYDHGLFYNEANTPWLRTSLGFSNVLYSVAEKDSSISFFFGDNVHLANIYRGHVDTFSLPPGYTQGHPHSLFFINKLNRNEYRLLFNDQLCTYNIATRSLKATPLPRMEGYLKTQQQEYMYDSSTLYTLNHKVIISMPHGFFKNNIVYKAITNGNDVLIGTNHGLFINRNIHLLPGSRVAALSMDNNGNYWVGTLDDGVYVLSSNFNAMQARQQAYKGRVLFAQADDRYVYFSTQYNDLWRLGDSTLRCLYRGEEQDATFRPTSIYAVFIAADHTYYSTYDEGGVIIKNIDGPSPYVYGTLSRPTAAKAILEANGALYLRRPAELVRVDGMSPGHSQLLNPREIYLGKRVYATTAAGDSSIWFSTASNVYLVKHDSVVLQPQFGNLSFYWFIIDGDELIGYTLANQLVVCSNIYGSRLQYSVVSDNCTWNKAWQLDAHHIMLATNNLYRIITLRPGAGRPQYSTTVVEDLFAPLNAEYVCQQAGKCYFFKNGSIITIDTAVLMKPVAPPQIVFTTLRTRDTVYPIGGAISLTYAQAHDITIGFVGLSHSSRYITYEYTMSKNGSGKWQEIASNSFNILNPSFGTYTVRVRARTISGVYGPPSQFTLVVGKPYWATAWFIGVVLAMGVAIVVLLIMASVWRVNRKRAREHEEKVKVMKSEYKALNALMNPHFIFNTINNIQQLVSEEDKYAAHQYLHTFAVLIRQNMHNISLELITLQKELDLVESYLKLEKLRFGELLNYRITIGDEVDPTDILIPPLLIQPLAENAIRHGLLPMQSEESLLWIKIYERDDKLYIDVTDNGVGINAEPQEKQGGHESYGLKNIRKRIEQLRVIYDQEIAFTMQRISEEGGTMARIVIDLGPGA